MYTYQYLCLPVAETQVEPPKISSLSSLTTVESEVEHPKISSVSRICWQTEMENLLIEEVKKRKLLWDTNDTLYSKTSLKKPEYNNIANILKEKWPSHSALFSSGEITRKYHNLRTYFTREMKKMKTSKENYVPRWIHFNKLSYLTNIQYLDDNSDESSLSVNMQDSNLDSNSEFEAVDIKHEPVDNMVEDVCTSSNIEEATPDVEQDSNKSLINCDISTQEEQEKTLIEKKNTCCQANRIKCYQNKHKNALIKLKESTEELYGKFIASQLQEITDPMQRDRARIEIQNILIKYKYGGHKLTEL